MLAGARVQEASIFAHPVLLAAACLTLAWLRVPRTAWEGYDVHPTSLGLELVGCCRPDRDQKHQSNKYCRHGLAGGARVGGNERGPGSLLLHDLEDQSRMLLGQRHE